MPFGIDLGDIFDVATDFIPGGDYIDDLFGIGDDPTTPPPATGRNGRAPMNGSTNGVAGMAGCRITMPMGQRTVASCPPGYVAVDTNGDGQTDACMLKQVARACGLWRPRPKPVMTASDRKALNKADRVMSKVDTIVKQTNSIRGQARLTKSRPSR